MSDELFRWLVTMPVAVKDGGVLNYYEIEVRAPNWEIAEQIAARAFIEEELYPSAAIDIECIQEDLHSSLKKIFYEFDQFCKNNGLFYDITADEHNRQGYVIRDKNARNKIYDHIAPIAEKYGLHMEVDDNRRDGVLFNFTLDAIKDDGHWAVLSSYPGKLGGSKGKHPKRHEFSFFVSDKDAKKVRAGKTIYQKKFKSLNDDQYKSPTRRHLRKQSMFPSSFSKSKSFGGVRGYGKKDVNEAAVLGSMIPPNVEAPSSLGLVSADRTNVMSGTGRETLSPDKKHVRSYRKRKSAVDLPDIPPYKKNDDVFNDKLQHSLEKSRYGRTNDKSSRPLVTRKIVPAAENQPANPVIETQQLYPTHTGSFSQSVKGVAKSSPDFNTNFGMTMSQAQTNSHLDQETQDIINNISEYPENTRFEITLEDGTKLVFNNKTQIIEVIKDRSAEIQSVRTIEDNLVLPNEPDNYTKPNMRPLGVFGPADNRQPSGGPMTNISTNWHGHDGDGTRFYGPSYTIMKRSKLNSRLNKLLGK